MANEPDWSGAVAECDIVIHLAASPDLLTGPDATERLFAINRDATVSLAEAALNAGVKTFVFISTVKVWGDNRETPYDLNDTPAPTDDYGRSKWEAEQELLRLTQNSTMDLLILRPSMVFGAGDGGNFARLVSMVSKPIPLPFASVKNKRSMILVDDLVRLILGVALKSEPRQTTYLLAHRDTASTPQLIRAISEGLDQSPRLVPFPPTILDMALKMLRQGGIASRLLGSYFMNASPIYAELGLVESGTLHEQIAATARACPPQSQ